MARLCQSFPTLTSCRTPSCRVRAIGTTGESTLTLYYLQLSSPLSKPGLTGRGTSGRRLASPGNRAGPVSKNGRPVRRGAVISADGSAVCCASAPTGCLRAAAGRRQTDRSLPDNGRLIGSSVVCRGSKFTSAAGTRRLEIRNQSTVSLIGGIVRYYLTARSNYCPDTDDDKVLTARQKCVIAQAQHVHI